MTELEARGEKYLKDTNFGRLVMTSGWDPEIFVTKKDGELIPAFEFLPPKSRAIKFDPYNNGYNDRTGTVYHDGFAAEYTTHPSACHQIGMDLVRAGIKQIHEVAQKKYPGSKLTLQSFYRIPDLTLRKFPLEYIALGCKPSLNAYSQAPILFDDPIGMPYRMAGGHVHFGLADSEYNRRPDKVWDMNLLVKFMDLFCALPCVALFDGIDFPLRRSYYGRAGEYRKTRYGIEYRVLSNAWLADPHFAHLVMNMARAATTVYNSGAEITSFGLTEEQIQQIINNADATSARAWIKEYWPFFQRVMLKEHCGTRTDSKDKSHLSYWEAAFNKTWPIEYVLLKGMKNHLKDWDNIPLNWGFSHAWGYQSNGCRAQWKNYVDRETTGCFNPNVKEKFLSDLAMPSV